jgi:hypothetical protein
MKRKKKKKEKQLGAFFFWARTVHTLLAVLGRVFVAGKCK